MYLLYLARKNHWPSWSWLEAQETQGRPSWLWQEAQVGHKTTGRTSGTTRLGTSGVVAKTGSDDWPCCAQALKRQSSSHQALERCHVLHGLQRGSHVVSGHWEGSHHKYRFGHLQCGACHFPDWPGSMAAEPEAYCNHNKSKNREMLRNVHQAKQEFTRNTVKLCFWRHFGRPKLMVRGSLPAPFPFSHPTTSCLSSRSFKKIKRL